MDVLRPARQSSDKAVKHAGDVGSLDLCIPVPPIRGIFGAKLSVPAGILVDYNANHSALVGEGSAGS